MSSMLEMRRETCSHTAWKHSSRSSQLSCAERFVQHEICSSLLEHTAFGVLRWNLA